MLAWFFLVELLFFVVSGLLTNGTSSNGTTSTSTTNYPSTTTMFHTINGRKYFINIHVTLTFECSNIDSTTNKCPNLSEIQNSFINLLKNLHELSMLTKVIDYDSPEITDQNDGTITIVSTIYTDNNDDFNDLKTYIVSNDFKLFLENDLESDTTDLNVISIKTTIKQSGEDIDHKGGKKMFDQWLDPSVYTVFQWVIVSLIFFFLILCIGGCWWWCCCRTNAKDDSNFMNNPHRYDSEFP
eukprot:837828_1